jgi:acyl-CoA thioester hydrolase
VPESASRLRVRYVETDQMGVVHHASYLAWLEVARTDYLRDRGISYRELEALGFRLPVLGVEVRYLKPALYDDEILVRARLASAGGVRFTFEYDVERPADGEVLARGRTEHAATDHSGRPRRLPKDLLHQIGGHLEAVD